MVRGFWKLQEVHIGLNPENVVTMSLALPQTSYPKNEMIDGFWTRLEDRMRSLPGVRSAAIVSGLPPLRPPNMNDTHIEGFVRREGGPIEEIRPGDIVWFEPGEKHWHGASPTTAMTHIAIAEALDGRVVDWLEKVSDEQYGQ